MYNKCFMVGKVTSEIESKTIGQGTRVSTFRIKTHDPYDQYHTINCYDKTADSTQKLKRDDVVFIEGRVVTRKYTDKSGVVKYITTINAARVSHIDEYKNMETTQKEKETEDDF